VWATMHVDYVAPSKLGMESMARKQSVTSTLSLSHVHGHIFFQIVGFVCCQGFSYRVCSNHENKMWCVDSDCWRQQGDGVMLKCSAILLVVLFLQIIDLPGINPVS